MPWARFDDRYDDHPDIETALERAPTAIALHVMAITYCCRHNTNGLIPARRVDYWLSRTPLRGRQKQEALNAMLELKLIERVDEATMRVCNFLTWNLSREQRKDLSEQGRRGGRSRKPRPPGGSSPRSEGSSEGQSEGLSDGLGEGLSGGGKQSMPCHAMPINNTSRALRGDGDEKASPDDHHLCRLLAELATERNPKFKVRSRSRWLTDMRLLRERDGNSAQEIERAVRWALADGFWGGVIQSPGNLREHFPRVWDQMGRGRLVALPTRESASDWLREDDFVEGTVEEDRAVGGAG